MRCVALTAVLGFVAGVWTCRAVDYVPEPGRTFLTDSQTWRPAPEIGNAFTAEILFVPKSDDLMPSNARPKTEDRSLFNLGSGYFEGFRFCLKTFGSDRLVPMLGVGGNRDQARVEAFADVPVVRGETNYLAAAWDGRDIRFRVNGRDAGVFREAWRDGFGKGTDPKMDYVSLGATGWGVDPLPVEVIRATIVPRALSAGELAARDPYSSGRRPAAFETAEAADRAARQAWQSPKEEVFADWAKANSAERAKQWKLACDVYRKIAARAGTPRYLVRDAQEQAVRCQALAEGRPAPEEGASERRPVPPAPEPGRRFFVAPDGDDRNDGSVEHPFRSLMRARDAVRSLRRKGGLPSGGVQVCLRGGRHVVSGTLMLTEEDSGERGRPVSYCAWRDECPVLDGGCAVTDFGPVADAAARARIPTAARDRVRVADVSAADEALFGPFEEFGTHFKRTIRRVTDFYCDGEALTPARHPNDDWLRIGATTGMVFETEVDLSRWTLDREPGLAIGGYPMYFWADATIPAVRVDATAGTVEMKAGIGRFTPPKKGQIFRFVNALAAVDEPGEWFLDRPAKRLYVYPKTGRTLTRGVLSSFGRPFVTAKGVHDLRIEGLVFEHGRHDAVMMTNCADIVFAGNVVRNFGGDGLQLFGVRRTLVAGNVIHTLGHTGIDLTSGDRKTLTSDETAVANNEIFDTGRAQRTYTPGIRCVGVGVEILHNRFHDIPSSSMNLGGNDLRVAWNRSERVVTESDDQGGIDMYGNTSWSGIEMCFNLWKDIGGEGVAGFPAGRAGIRLDDAISGMVIYGNRFVNAARQFGGVQIHAGRFNYVDNNLFVGGERGVSFSHWPTARWRKLFTDKWQVDLINGEVDVRREPYSSRYPHMSKLADSPMINFVTRNVFEVGPETKEVYGDTRFYTDIRHDAIVRPGERAADDPCRRPLPPEAAMDLYSDPHAARAARNDACGTRPRSVPSSVRLGAPFTNGAVLQRRRAVPVWGEARPGEKVSVSFAGQRLVTTADAQGRWRVNLAPMEACSHGRTLQANDSRVDDVLVGEVWFCAGQSNAEFYFCSDNPRCSDRQGHLLGSMIDCPEIRFVDAQLWKGRMEPQRSPIKKLVWRPFTPENLLENRGFSAIGVYFAREIGIALRVPIGIVGTSVGGTRIEPWIPKCGFEAIASCRAEANWTYSDGCESRHAKEPSLLWNSLVEPWTPYAIRGMIWYQGCSNAREHARYCDMMHALYAGWSKKFENPDLRMEFVQLAPWGDAVIPLIQEAQARFAREEKNAHMAVVNDVGNLHDVHPNDKGTVGLRLAALALRHEYGFSDVRADAPEFDSFSVEGDRLVVRLRHARRLYLYNRDPDDATTGFELAGADGKFVPAKIVNMKKDGRGALVGSTVVLQATGVSSPRTVRYLHSHPWYGALHNEADLPLGAFHASD